MDFTRHVDPFLGNGEIDLPEPSGIAATWFFIKAQTGNTHPGACSPFGMVSACPYSGAYVTGYGLNAPNSHARPPRHLDEYSASGFTHFHPSGTGAVGVYGNYFRVTPLVGDLRQLGTRWPLEDEYRALQLAVADIRKERNRDFREQGVAQPFTHNLDLADACAAIARIAAHLGEKEIHRELSTLARQWKNAYDPATVRFGENTLQIRAIDNSAENIYVQSAFRTLAPRQSHPHLAIPLFSL